MQRTAVYILLPLIAFSVLGYFMIFMYQQAGIRQTIKQQIKAGVPEDELVVLKFQKNLRAVKNISFVNDHEFRHEGKLYDIVRQELHGAEIWLYCIDDTMETALYSNLDEAVSHNMDSNAAGRRRSKQFIKLMTSVYLSSFLQLTYYEEGKEVIFSKYQLSFSEQETRPPSPPPKYMPTLMA